MLAPILILVALMLVITEAMLTIGLTAAKITLHQKASLFAEIAMDRSVQEHLEFVRTAVRDYGATVVSTPATATGSPTSGASSAAFVDTALMGSPHSACIDVTAVPGVSNTCTMTYLVTVHTNASTLQTSGAQPAVDNQLAGTYANEQKVAETITVTLLAPSGAVLAQRSRFLTMRVFENAPYVALTGVRDTTADVGSQQSGEGDSAGYVSNLATAATPALTTPASIAAGTKQANDTALRVQVVCQQYGNQPGAVTTNWITGPIASEGRPWGNGGAFGYDIGCDNPALSADQFTPPSWDTGTENLGILPW